MAPYSLRPSADHLSSRDITHSAYAIAARTASSSANTSATYNNTPQTCVDLSQGQMIISRPTFIATITAFALFTFISLLLLIGYLHRTYQRRKQDKAAKIWGHRSRFDQRISMLRKEVDDSYTRQYAGCLMNPIPENPEMGSESPVEIMSPERVWEVSAKRSTRKSKGKSLFFDHSAGVWFPKR